MQLLGLGAMLLAQLGVSAVTFTFSEVQAQIEAYQEQNGTHVAPSDPQFGCTLAVRHLPESCKAAQKTCDWPLIHAVVWLLSLQPAWKAFIPQ